MLRFKAAKDREPYHKAMRIMLPMFLERLCQLNEDQSDLSVLTQKQILKIFFTFVQFILPLDVLDKHSMSTWIEICNLVLSRPVPDVTKFSIFVVVAKFFINLILLILKRVWNRSTRTNDPNSRGGRSRSGPFVYSIEFSTATARPLPLARSTPSLPTFSSRATPVSNSKFFLFSFLNQLFQFSIK